MDMERLDAMMARLDRHQPLTAYECLRLVMIAQHAAKFTKANDEGDDIEALLDGDGEPLLHGTEEELTQAAVDADDAYNRSKDELFCAVRELMAWPGRAAKYLPEHLGGCAVHPHPFAQEGTM